MTPEELEAWLLSQPLVLGYILFLLVGSLISFIVLIVKVRKAGKLGRYPVSNWPLSGHDFAIFIMAILAWFVVSGYMVLYAHQWIMGPEAVPGSGVAVIAGILLQGGMLYLFLRFKFHHRNPNEGPISSRILSIPQSLAQGLFYFLASLPVVYGVSMAWTGFLELLRSQGFDIELPLQQAVLLLQNTTNPVVFAGFLILAVIIAPAVEETVFRAGVYRFFKGRTSIPVSLFISGLLFGIIHWNLQSLPGLVAVGVCLGLAYELSGSLRVSIFFHAFFNLNSVIWIFLIPDALIG
ncbi:MAG: lysostaphin resistance A-like protein [Puniceicoccaceae bacterium]